MPDHWLLLALAASAIWALCCIADVCLIGERVYRLPSDGAVIAGMFCAVPAALLLPQADGLALPAGAALASSAAGGCYFLHVYFQFRALLFINDACNTEIFNTLAVLFVPVLAFGLLGERLAPIYYGLLGLALGGCLLLLRCQFGHMHRKALVALLASVLCMSLAMVLQARSFRQADYAGGVLAFSAATLIIAATVAVSGARRRRRFVELWRNHAWLFVGLQLLELTALFLSQRATAVAPSVSLVALAECSLPVFIIIFSAAACRMLGGRARPAGSIRPALAGQARHLKTKLVSLGLIALTIAVVPLDPG